MIVAVCINHPDSKASVDVDSLWFCTPCFLRFMESRARAAIERHRMVAKGDSIAVGLSGGKDSSALLLILRNLESRLHISRLVAITVDEGIAGYREEAISMAKSLTKENGIEHVVIRLRDIFGVDVDALADAAGGSLCSTCGVLRRRALDIVASERGCQAIGTGHTRGDNAETFLMNIFRGEPQRLARAGPMTRKIEGFVPRIKPLCYLSEREVTLYAYLSNIRFQTRTCPYRAESLRLQVLKMLKQMEGLNEGVQMAIIRTLDGAYKSLSGRHGQMRLRSCVRCGYPSVSGICMACGFIMKYEQACGGIRDAGRSHRSSSS